jgi:hypothetical protein
MKDIKELNQRNAYVCRNLPFSYDIQYKNENVKMKKVYVRRLGLVLGTELRVKNKIQAIGALALPVLRYSFGIVNWHP